MKRPNTDETAPTVGTPGSYLSDESVYNKASRSNPADKFNVLWTGENPEGKSHSEADMALSEILAFWCGLNIEQMDRLFRKSELMRDKCDRPQSGSTYGMLTLAKAVQKCTTFYSPTVVSDEKDFNDILPRLMEFDPATCFYTYFSFMGFYHQKGIFSS